MIIFYTWCIRRILVQYNNQDTVTQYQEGQMKDKQDFRLDKFLRSSLSLYLKAIKMCIHILQRMQQYYIDYHYIHYINQPIAQLRNIQQYQKKYQIEISILQLTVNFYSR